MGYEKTFVKMNINGKIKETDKAYLLKMPNGSEVWFPKSHCRNLDSNSCEITEYMLKQKNMLGSTESVENVENGWKCVNCGANTKKGFKYCLDCYKKMKSGEQGQLSKKISIMEEEGKIKWLTEKFDDQYKHKLYCQKCGTIFYMNDGTYNAGIKCDYCGIELTDVGVYKSI